MSQIPSTAGTSGTNQPFQSKDAINDIDLSTFLKLMIAELQNQDPLNPLDNKDMLAQISQIREVGATDKLTETLEAVLLGQNISSATNLIGADITALSDDAEAVTGIVNRVSIEKGVPKLHLEQSTQVLPSAEEGNIDAGTYSYRVVWENDQGALFGLDFSGNNAITTTGTAGVDSAIQLRNLPLTAGPKQIYRTDSSGDSPYQLVGVVTNGKQGSFIDGLADDELSGTQLTRTFQRTLATGRAYLVSLNNVSGVRPPAISNSDDQ
jgi:hypothetical protein